MNALEQSKGEWKKKQQKVTELNSKGLDKKKMKQNVFAHSLKESKKKPLRELDFESSNKSMITKNALSLKQLLNVQNKLNFVQSKMKKKDRELSMR